MSRSVARVLAALTLPLFLLASAVAENRDAMLQRVSDVIGMTYPIDAAVNPPKQDGGGVTGGFMWDANGRMLKWAYDGQMMAIPVGGSAESIRRYLYLGATYPTFPEAQRLQIGSEKEQALCDALRLFCDDVLPSVRFDSLNAALGSATNDDVAHQLASMTEAQRDALRLWPVVREVTAQMKRQSSK